MSDRRWIYGASVEFGDIRGEPTAAPYVEAFAERTAIGAGAQTFLDFENVALSDTMGFAVNIEFGDVSGKRWFSRGFYSEAEHQYRDVEVFEGTLSEAQKLRLVPRVRDA